MKFTLTINQAGATIAGLAGKLDIIDLAIFDAFKDFANGKRLLSLEQTPTELVWSSGDQLASEVVAKAFKLEGKADLLKRDVEPFSAAKSVGIGTIIVVLVITLILLSLLSRCSSCDPKVENCSSSSSSRSSGGSWGGFSGGGGHK